MALILAFLNVSTCLGQASDARDSVSENTFRKHRDVSVCVSFVGSYIHSRSYADETIEHMNIGGMVTVDEWLHRSWAFSYGLQYSVGRMEGLIVEGHKHLWADDSFHYLGIPLLAKWKPMKNNGFVVGAGFRPDLLLGAKEVYSDFYAEHSRDVSDCYNKFDCKFVVDVSYTFSNGVKLGLGMDTGLCNVGSTRHVVNDPKYTNRSILCYVGYRF